MPNLPTLKLANLGTFPLAIAILLASWLTGLQSRTLADQPVHIGRNRQPNVLLICVDDLRPELNCFGVDYIHSPNIDQLANQGVRFSRHFVQAPTCGASRFALLTGTYGPAGNGALFGRAADIRAGKKDVKPSLPGWFRQHGYETVSVGKVSHHPGGQGGADWNDADELEMPDAWDLAIAPSGKWKHPRGWMHGLAEGEIRIKAGEMDLFQSSSGPDSIYPDGHSIEDALKQLDRLGQDDQKPFFLAVGILRPHLPFGAPAKYMEHYRNAELPPTPHPKKPAGKTTWHGSGEFMKYHRWGRNPNNDPAFALDVRKHYAACVTYADAQVGKLLKRLETIGAAENTIVILWGDHGWHLGEHAIWGKHALFEESLRSPLIIKLPESNSEEQLHIAKTGANVSHVVETIDLFPTLCELTGLERPSTCQGVSLVGVDQTNHRRATKTSIGAIAYRGNATTIRTERYRMVQHKGGHVELYDHQSSDGETNNIANAQPDVVSRLREQMKQRMK
ncbi:MAG: sulfatase [Planctomycetota bacterium]